jgi:hypothetical protein
MPQTMPLPMAQMIQMLTNMMLGLFMKYSPGHGLSQ